MSVRVKRGDVLNFLREQGWTFQRKAKRVEIYRERATPNRLVIPINDSLPEPLVRAALTQGGFTPAQIDAFMVAAVKDEPPKGYTPAG